MRDTDRPIYLERIVHCEKCKYFIHLLSETSIVKKHFNFNRFMFIFILVIYIYNNAK